MATKVGGLFISLALDMAQFDDGMQSAADKTQKMEKFQGDLEKAMTSGSKSSERMAEKMLMLSGAGSEYNSIVVASIQSFEKYNEKIEAVYKSHGMAITGIVKVQAAMAAFQATAKAFAPLLIFDALVKGAQMAGEAIGNLKNELERIGQESEIAAFGTKTKDEIAIIRAELRAMRKEEVSENDIVNDENRSAWGQLFELKKLLAREQAKEAKKIAEEQAAADVKSFAIEQDLDKQYRANQIANMEEMARAEAEINAKYDEARQKTFGIISDEGRQLAQNRIEEMRIADIAKARGEFELKASQAVTSSVKSWIANAVGGWNKLKDQAKQYVDIVQGLGGDVLEQALFNSMGGANLGRDSKPADFNPSADRINAGAREMLQQKPELGRAGWDVESLSKLMREQIDQVKITNELIGREQTL